MKKIVEILCAAGILLGILSGCEKKSVNSAKTENIEKTGEKINVVATIFPFYDWAKNIAGDVSSVNLELLVKNGVDLHSFQPSAGDIIKISTADVLIFAGGESDSWIKDVLKNPVNKNIAAVNLMELLKNSVKAEEIVEGMMAEEEDEHSGGESHHHDEGEEIEYDEHVWLSVENAKTAVNEIAEILAEKNPGSAEIFAKNKSSYLKELEGLEEFFTLNGKGAAEKTMVVCDRFPFRYMADELGIKYFAAFPGCSAETEASFETVAFLSKKIRELGARKVFVTESSDKKIAETVVKNAGLEGKCKIETLDSMQSATLEQAKNGKNYIETMKENYEKLLG